MATGESAVSVHARNLGCHREAPLSGLCVACPFQQTCEVQRIPIVLWTARLAMEAGRAEPVFYLNDLATAPIGKLAKPFPRVKKISYRTTAVEMRCGDVCTGKLIPESEELNLASTLSLFDFLGIPQCEQYVLMDSRQVRYQHLSNFGRKATLAVQTCSKECAQRLSEKMNRKWHQTVDLVRQIRPLRKMPTA